MRVIATIAERPGPKRQGVWVGFVVPDAVVSAMAGEAAVTRRRLPVEMHRREKLGKGDLES